MANDVSICNLALSHLVQRQTITSINPPGSNAYELACNSFWPSVYDRALGDADWDFARKRVALTAVDLGTAQPVDFDYAFELPIASYGTFVTTHATDILTGSWSTLRAYDRVRVASATTLPAGFTADTDYYIIKTSNTVIKLASSYSDAVAGTAVTISDDGTGTHTLYVFDMIKPRLVKEVDDSDDNDIHYRIEGNYLLSNTEETEMVYTSRVYDYTLLSADFEMTASVLMASMLAGHVAKGDSRLRKYWMDEYKAELARSASEVYNRGHNSLLYVSPNTTDR